MNAGAASTPGVASVCCYCGTGCGLTIAKVGAGGTDAAAAAIEVQGDATHPANFGRLCSKGATLPLTLQRTGRALHPELRTARDRARQAVSWDEALDAAAQRFAEIIRRDGPDAVAFYVSGQLLTEDYYVFNKLARALVGTNNIDSNSRLCMSSAVAGYKATLGADAVPCTYADIELADLFLLAGSNTAWAHPVLMRRIEAAKAARPQTKIVVVDPRRTDTAAMADLHLALNPGSDAVLYSAMLNVMLWEGWIDENFIAANTVGWPELRRQLREMTPGAVAATCGLKSEDIVLAARWFAEAYAPLSMYCQGLNQSIHGVANNAAIVHLHLATGKIGRPGMGPFSLTGQANAMGGREVGAMAGLLPGHRDPAKAEDRDELARLWGVAALPDRPGKTATEIFDALADGTIKAVWIACTNPAQSLPDQAKVRAALQAAEFVVVQDAYATIETADYADLLLPAASWGEKNGTVTNSERRISRVRAAMTPPGEARADWRIAAEFGRRLQAKLGAGETAAAADAAPLFEFAGVAAVYDEYVETTVGRDLDIGGLSHEVLDRLGPQTWPFPAGARAGQARLYQDHRFATPDGRARFVALNLSLTAESPDARYPLRLTTGRLRDQWHGMSRSGRTARLTAHEPLPCVRLHAGDMQRRGLQNDDLVRVVSRRGEIVLPVQASEELKPGMAFIAMHWGAQSLSHAGVNELTIAAVDPVSKQPELKHAAIRVERIELPYRVMALRGSALGEEELLSIRERVAALLGRFDYASLTLAGREQPFLRLQIADELPLAEGAIQELLTALSLDDGSAFRDPARHIVKCARIATDDRLEGILLAGETAASAWLGELMCANRPLGDVRRWLFAPSVNAPNIGLTAGRTICSCFGVGQSQIERLSQQGMALPEIQTQLKCGTSCGSCVPELRRIVDKRVEA
ncbi:MAG TPA: molybdopterin-dependent oxidoreductase [Rhodocyclaceae bacterium]|nr:molybdopterin-dependent oxidoreductase [Rhodocyclaceae bacterium]